MLTPKTVQLSAAKVFRDYDGNVTRVGRLEAYIPKSRNYKANPIYFRERANMTAFGNASHLAQEFIDSMRNKTPFRRKNKPSWTPTKPASMPNSTGLTIPSHPKIKTATTSSIPA